MGPAAKDSLFALLIFPLSQVSFCECGVWSRNEPLNMTFWGIVRYRTVFSYNVSRDCGSVRVVQHPLHTCVVGNEPGQIFRGPSTALPLLSGGYHRSQDHIELQAQTLTPTSLYKASILQCPQSVSERLVVGQRLCAQSWTDSQVLERDLGPGWVEKAADHLVVTCVSSRPNMLWRTVGAAMHVGYCCF